jgi:hypothetical protein
MHWKAVCDFKILLEQDPQLNCGEMSRFYQKFTLVLIKVDIVECLTNTEILMVC